MKKKNVLPPRAPEPTRFSPDWNVGLTEEQVDIHEEEGYTNEAVDSSAKTVKDIVLGNLFTYFNLIFLVLSILLIIVGSYRDLTFLPVIIINTLIGIIQEIRSKKVLDNLNMLNQSTVQVVRNKQSYPVSIHDLVLDDIVQFSAGNQICADAVVQQGEVQVNEALLTGESDEITKRPGDPLLSGSFIVSGNCFARLEKVGRDSYINKLTLEAKSTKSKEQSEMIRSLDRLVKMVGIIIIPIGILLFMQSFYYNGETFRESIRSMVAAIVGMIPEGLYLLASVALAVSSMRLAKQSVLLHDMKSIETLARVDVLCVDKTGTITENTMQVHKLIPSKVYDGSSMPSLESLVADFANAQEADNITMEALKAHFTQHTDARCTQHTGFSSTYKYSSATFSGRTLVLGAPEFVLRDAYDTYADEIRPYAEKGYRTLVFGSYDGTPDGGALTEAVVPLGYVLLSNPIRKEAPDTFRFFAEQNVDVKVISGDNPATVSEVAAQAGIANASSYIDASTLHTENDVYNAVAKYTVFGRVNPEQKRQIVKALQSQGRTVAMTGDGVNDVLALKDADCSVAMAAGSDAAIQAAQLVLLESNFSRMTDVVMEGRRVVNNIQRSASLFLIKNVFSLLLAIFSLVLMYTYPLSPSQVSLISIFTIGFPAFFLALEPNKNMIKGHFLTNAFLKALPAALTDVIVVASLVIFGNSFDVDPNDIATAATMLLAIVGFMILFKINYPMNKFRWIVLITSILGLLGCSFFLPQLFSLSHMSKHCIMLFGIFSIATEPVFRYLSIGTELLEKRIAKRNQKRREKKRAKVEKKIQKIEKKSNHN
ncbi:MAG: HAD-IC family P-type ATPase [Lachnospiraceae bacterium]